MKKCILIYKSLATSALFKPGEFDQLAGAASGRNEDYGTTDVLVLTGDQILQALEGPLSTDWSMRFVDLEKLPEGVLGLFRRNRSFNDGVPSVPNDKLGAISLLIDVQTASMSN